MSDDDASQKTEEPSWRKLDEARSKGQVPQSREVTSWFVVVGGTASVVLYAPNIADTMQRAMYRFFEQSASMRIDSTFHAAILSTITEVAISLAPAFLIMMGAGLAGPMLQTGMIYAPDKLIPKLSHLSPGEGLKRLISTRAFLEFIKGLLKMAVVGGVAVKLLLPEIDRLSLMPSLGISQIGPEIARVSLRVAIGVIAVLTVIAIADFAYQKFSFIKSMRMSKQEVKEEYKQQEGNPVFKSKLRQIRTERARRRMMTAVPTASVVITNPTHFAVALLYEANSSGAPRVVAKGADRIAAKIREIAEQHKVPIVENPPVARALYATVEIDDEIPAEQYKAVAEIISYVMRLKGAPRPR
ncbi:MAG TPA: flagellar biosynthesis protein FlhB [Stellaceae bacterium]|nr:flagellar biosynthesis protein FlhB [Stellaceae bacterium]